MKKLLLALLLLLSFMPVFADNCVYMLLFYSSTCPHCAQAELVLDRLKQNYNVVIDRREIHELGNSNLLQAYLSIYNVPSDLWGYVPVTFINNKYIVGFTEDYEQELLNGINYCSGNSCLCPFNQSLADYYGARPFPQVNETSGYYQGTNTTTPSKIEVTIPAIISAALVDSINPCAFAVIIFLLTYLISIGAKKRILKISMAYILTVFTVYFLAGLGLFVAMQSAHVTSLIYIISAVVAIIAGLVNVKDFFWYGKGFTLAIPKKAKPVISEWVKKASLPAAVVLGFLVSLYELPCTGGVYLAILGLLSNTMTRTQAVPPLLLYNLIFVLPLVIIAALINFGVSSEAIEKWRKAKRNYMKLAAGIVMILLGILMLGGWI
ncbi:Cytochrome C biogenesis protein transmembrane region [Candidatus Tiddalikarchaeum anstoanum]|nr:Cytochrome C biogenesis protein transmembrane region [Candidatus Tiddalikarchaeum anstoanum]